jgi:hypothetical protein
MECVYVWVCVCVCTGCGVGNRVGEDVTVAVDAVTHPDCRHTCAHTHAQMCTHTGTHAHTHRHTCAGSKADTIRNSGSGSCKQRFPPPRKQQLPTRGKWETKRKGPRSECAQRGHHADPQTDSQTVRQPDSQTATQPHSYKATLPHSHTATIAHTHTRTGTRTHHGGRKPKIWGLE